MKHLVGMDHGSLFYLTNLLHMTSFRVTCFYIQPIIAYHCVWELSLDVRDVLPDEHRRGEHCDNFVSGVGIIGGGGDKTMVEAEAEGSAAVDGGVDKDEGGGEGL